MMLSMFCPLRIRRDERTYKRRQPVGRRRMNSEQNNPGLFRWTSTLNGDLPKVLVKRQHDASFGFREIQQDDVPCSEKSWKRPRRSAPLSSKLSRPLQIEPFRLVRPSPSGLAAPTSRHSMLEYGAVLTRQEHLAAADYQVLRRTIYYSFRRAATGSIRDARLAGA